jgi:3-oxoacyl-[acyl-carrier-protein] synthase-3
VRSGIHKRFAVMGTGVALPERVMTNRELEKLVDTSDEWIRARTGIVERRIADEGTATSDLAAQALLAACGDASMDPAELDAIIVGTSTPDTMFPSTACWVQHRLALPGAAALDVSAGCTGWLYGLELAANLIAAGTARRVGVIGAEVMSKVIDWTDRSTCVLFGDGAGAAIIAATDADRGLLASNWGADGTLAPILYQPAGGTRRPATHATVDAHQHSVHMEGNAVFKHAVRAMSSAAVEAMGAAGIGPDEVHLFIPHQANSRIIEATRARTGIEPDRLHSVLERFGNMSAATIPVALHDARVQGRLSPGDLVVMTAFGTGLTWGAAVLRW